MLKHEICFLSYTGDLVHWFFNSALEREAFLRLNPTWKNNVSALDRVWDNYWLDVDSKQYILSRGTIKHYSTIHRPYGVNEYAVFHKDEKRKTSLGRWYYGHELPERRKVG